MATYGGPNYNIGETYNEFVDNINSNGGTLINIPSDDLKEGMRLLKYNSSILMVPNGFIGDQLPSMVPTDGTGDFTVSRNGTATYFDKNGLLKIAQANEPRLDFDSLTGEFKGVLVEPASTNLLTHSYNVGTSPWNALGTEVLLFPNQAEAPDGTFTAARYLSNSGAARSRIIVSVTSGVTYTMSFWAKNISMTQGNCAVTIAGSGNYNYIPLINTETWTRISHTFTALGTGLANYRLIQGGDIGGEILLWGAQFEESSRVSSYIPTSGSTVTRPADIISIPSYSSIFGQRNQRVININGTNQAIINDSTYILPEGHNKFTFEKTSEFTSQEINDLNIETIQYGIRGDIKEEYSSIFNLEPSLVMIPGIESTNSLQTIYPNDGISDFTIGRNGTATYLGADGLLKVADPYRARFEYNEDGTFKGVLVEPSTTNYFTNNTYSNMDGYTHNNFLFTRKIGQGIYGIDSIEGAAQEPYISGQIQLRYIMVLDAGYYTHTFYVKKSSNFNRIEHLGSVQLNELGQSQQQLGFNTTTGVITPSIGITQYNSEDKGDWWKVSYSVYCSGVGIAYFDYEPIYSDTTSFEICGSQIENGTNSTSLILTTGSQVTRVEDIYSRSLLPVDSMPYGEGTLYCEINKLNSQFSQVCVLGSNPEFLYFGLTDDKFRVGFRIDGGNTYYKLGSSDFSSVKENGPHKLLLTFKDEVIKFYCDGEYVTSRPYQGVFNFNDPNLSRFNLNRLYGSTAISPIANIKNFAVFKRAITDEEAISLTTL